MLTRQRAIRLSCAAAFAVVALAASCTRDNPTIVEGGDARRAPAAVATYGCGSCHTIPGIRGADATVAPSLAKFGQRGVIAGSLPITPENLVSWIMDPQSLEPGVAMPDMGVTEQDAKDIAEYLLALDG